MPPENVSGFTERLTAKHLDPLMDEGLHEHTWSVTAFWPTKPVRDGRALKAALRMLLDALPDADGVLPRELWSGEDMAEHVSRLLLNMGCIGARVTRPEGFEAWAWR